MNLPSFLCWLWTKISSLSMVLSLLAYLLLGVTGIGLFCIRHSKRSRPSWLRVAHYTIGWVMVGLVLFLFAIGLVTTLALYGTLGQSQHFIAGLSVVLLVLLSAGSAAHISPKRPWARAIHIAINIVLCVGFIWVLLTGWQVVQKYSTLNRPGITEGEYSKGYSPSACRATLNDYVRLLDAAPASPASPAQEQPLTMQLECRLAYYLRNSSIEKSLVCS
jgi:thiol:disulfide interchange protein